MSAKSNQYFASQDKDELAATLEGKIGEWSSTMASSGIKNRWVKSYKMYYGRHFKGDSSLSDSEILRMGDDGELAALTVNHYRNLIKHIHILTCSQKPAFDARAVNSDLKSLQQAKLANNILDAYLREKKLGRYLRSAAEQALVFGKGFVRCVWEPSLGNPYAVEDYQDHEGKDKQRLKNEGDVDVSNPSPFDVYVDQTCEDWAKVQWAIIRSFKNKYDLAVRHPEVADKILNTPTKSELDGIKYTTFQNLDDTTDIPVYEFYHNRTDALPNGRYMLFVGSDCVLYDGPTPYKTLPIFRITAGEIFGTTEGYTDAFDLMALQEAYDVLMSSVFSNQQAFAVQNILVPEGCNVTADQISKSLAVLKYNPQAGEPKALQLCESPKEVFNMIELIEKTMETLSGVNSVARGNPETSLKSGVALGLVQSMAVQFASGFQQSWAELLEDVGSFLLNLIKDFAQTPRLVALAGKYNKGNMAEFTGQDLANIDRVVVELGNPMARTTAGKVEIANNLLQQGLIKTPQEYLNVMNTGSLDPLLEGAEAEIALIRKENEEMMDGRPVQGIVGDAHVLHMQEHKALLANPIVRMNSQTTQLVLSHIQEHMQLYRTQDPLWSMVAGEPPAPPPPPPPPMPGPGIGPGAPGGDSGGPGGPPPQGPPPPMPPHGPPPPHGGGPAHHMPPPSSVLTQQPMAMQHIARLPAQLQPQMPVPNS